MHTLACPHARLHASEKHCKLCITGLCYSIFAWYMWPATAKWGASRWRSKCATGQNIIWIAFWRKWFPSNTKLYVSTNADVISITQICLFCGFVSPSKLRNNRRLIVLAWKRPFFHRWSSSQNYQPPCHLGHHWKEKSLYWRLKSLLTMKFLWYLYITWIPWPLQPVKIKTQAHLVTNFGHAIGPLRAKSTPQRVNNALFLQILSQIRYIIDDYQSIWWMRIRSPVCL